MYSKQTNLKVVYSWNGMCPVDTGRKLNVHMTFRIRSGRLLNALCTFNLRPVSTGWSLKSLAVLKCESRTSLHAVQYAVQTARLRSDVLSLLF